MMAEKPDLFKIKVQETLRHTTQLINIPPKERISLITEMLLLEASPSADVMAENHIDFRYPSYVQDHGPICFDYGFGPFRWVCASENQKIYKTDVIACKFSKKKTAPEEIQQQMQDNIQWIKVHRKIN
jgi:urocanate hydratase